MRFLAPPFSQTHSTRTHTHAHTPTGKELKERGGVFLPSLVAF